MKLVIGSAQMGMRYGLFNKKKISKVDIDKITRIAHAAKIDLIDTASVYGDSEKIIGKSKLNKLKIITKFKFPKIKSKSFAITFCIFAISFGLKDPSALKIQR
jgi:aryl-alcohol dehydrogenase-like predicted oxidoreductase